MTKENVVNRAIELIPISAIKIKKNIRRGEIPVNDPKILELAENIKQVGILEPLIANRLGNSEHYELIAGHRRLTAARIAKCERVPAIVHNGLNACQILEIQISENLHRADLLPSEEAEVYVRMRDELGLPIEDIALRIGRSQAHIYNHIKLLTLSDSILKCVDSGEIGIAKALFLCTLPKKIIDKIMSKNYNFILRETSKNFPATVKRYFMTNLGGELGFDMDKDYADKNGSIWPACTRCPHKNQQNLFSEILKDDVCQDKDCFNKKGYIAAENRRAEQAKNGNAGDDDYKETEEERLEREERERKWNAEREKREAEENEFRKSNAIKYKEKVDYYLAHKFRDGLSVRHNFFYIHKEGFLERYDSMENEKLDELYVKYIGKNLAEIRETATSDELINAALIYTIFNQVIYNGNKVAQWIGCDAHPDDQTDETESEHYITRYYDNEDYDNTDDYQTKDCDIEDYAA
jgi:ParB family chromosome partitioning protein